VSLGGAFAGCEWISEKLAVEQRIEDIRPNNPMTKHDKLVALKRIRGEVIDKIYKERWEEVWFFAGGPA
jgi:hypothetical protein